MRIDPEDRLAVETDYEPIKAKKKSKPPPPPRRPRKSTWWPWFFKWSFILLIWAAFVAGCGVLWFSYDLPDITKLQQTERKPSITVLAKDGTKLATYGDLHGQMVDIKKLPPHVTQAILAIEDRRFYSHFGVDLIGLFRAVWKNYQAGHVVQGGSTITQQLAKNFLQSEKLYDINDRSLRRKIQEAILAVWLESKFTKNQILTIYLNRVYLGAGTYGLAAASQQYFGKRPQDLSIYEAAVIAGLLKAPSKFSPSNNPELSDERAAQVLDSMAKEGFITEGAKEAALALSSSTVASFKGSAVRYFTDWVVDTIPNDVDTLDKDLIITTTLDPHLQSLAEDKLQEVMGERKEPSKVSQMSIVSMTYDGAIRALVGGANYKQSQFNRATQALRQVGSTFKLIEYLSALEAGMHPADIFSDTPVQIGSWRPKNHDLYKARGDITLQDALAYSSNTVSVRLAQQLGLPRIHETARRLGMKSRLPDDLTIVLGTGETTLLELTSAFLVIARNGLSVEPYAISKITDLQGNILYVREPYVAERVVDPSIATTMTNMLHGVMTYGTGKKAAIPGFCAGKTGTTQKERDYWFVGYTPSLITGTWSGNDDNTSMSPKLGSPAARLWHVFMAALPQYQSQLPQEAIMDVEEPSSGGGLIDGLLDSLFGD